MIHPIKSAEFIKSAVHPDKYPPDTFPEAAFAGRSNVGKSSLINCLVQRKKLVRTSRTPGQTQLINFFLINQAFYFVDLPGYGYAKVPERIRAQWGPMVEAYLTKRASLRGVIHIMDIRHPPTPDDLQLHHWLQDKNIPAIAVMTKADKIKRSQYSAHLKQASLSLGMPTSDMVLFSSETQQGREELLDRLMAWLEVEPPSE
ncbi:MAG: ribosome biogenesis GTP-binding protein YihA/YsxC [Acidobacteriota bacterium]